MIINWSSNFTLIEKEDFKYLVILITGTGLLSVIEWKNRPLVKERQKLFRDNLFLTSILMTIVILFGILTNTSSHMNYRFELLNALKPLLLALVLHVACIRIIGNQARKYPKDMRIVTLLESLSRREKEVYDLAVKGLSNKEIGDTLFIAESTVKKHMQHILKKLECSNRDELMSIETHIDKSIY